jgi:DNA mismatch repair protein MLH1
LIRELTFIIVINFLNYKNGKNFSANVDVNVSPTKNEVTFLNEDLIVDFIKESAEEVLLKTNETRRVYVQQLLPGASQSFCDSSQREDRNKSYAKDMIRTDAGIQSIVKFLNDPFTPNLSISFEKLPSRTLETTKLTSISELREEIEKNCDENLKDQIRKLTFVGNVDRSKSLIQCDNLLYICDSMKLAKELFYQESIRKFENFDRLEIENSLPINKLARIGFDRKECGWTEDDGSKDELALQVQKILTEQREMLQEYFQISINEEGEIESLPMIIENYSPLMAHLPMFLIRLATEVDFEHEKDCFTGIAKELAIFYSRWSHLEDEKSFNYSMEHIIFPKIQKYLYPPKSFCDDGTFLVLTKLQELYKVFERC